MSWLAGFKPSTSKSSGEDTRETKRKQLEAAREARLKQRIKLKKQLLAAQEAQEEANKAKLELLALDPSIFTEEKDTTEIRDSEEDELLMPDEVDNAEMADFDTANGTDGDKALEKIGSIKCEFDKSDIDFWFSEFESQLEVIDVQSQWLKSVALRRILPAEMKQEVKSLLTLKKTQAGNDIYLRIKTELIDLFGAKPEDAYIRAKNRVMTGKPSQLGKLLVDDICTCVPKLNSGCCTKIVWGMFREALPRVIRNHIAEETFNKDTYKKIFATCDKIYDSNQGSDAPGQKTIVAATAVATNDEVAALSSKRRNKNQR